jgi:thiamine-phosphate pyrophosphorylase
LKIKNNKKVDFKLYLITDRNLVTRHSSLVTAVRQALKGGVRAVQLREKDLSSRELLRLAYRMRDLTEQYHAKLFINDRFDIALAAGADGVHLTQSSIPTEAVRKAVKRKLLIAVSTHSPGEAQKAAREGADFLTLGPVYRTRSKLKYGKPLGIETFRRVCRRTKIPVFAIGGIRGDRIQDVLHAGASGAAMISGIFNAEDIQGKAREIKKTMEGSESSYMRND